MPTKIKVKDLSSPAEKIYVWDGELYEAASEYKKSVKLWRDKALIKIKELQ